MFIEYFKSKTRNIVFITVIKLIYEIIFSVNKIMETKYQNIVENNNTKETVLAFPQILKNYSKSENMNCLHKSNIFTTCDCILASKNENNFTQIDQMNNCFKELKIQTKVEHIEGAEKYLAGNINNIIKTLNVVLVKPLSLDILLYLGTPLFLNYTNIQSSRTEYTFLGYIDDIFGPVEKPLYSVTMKHNPEVILNINHEVYYIPNNPNTSHIYIEYREDDVSNKKKYKVLIKNL